MDLNDCFTSYLRKFDQASANKPAWRPWLPADRAAIRQLLKQQLNIRDEWIPAIQTEVQAVTSAGTVEIEHLRSESWPGIVGAADCYCDVGGPGGLNDPRPFVYLACGHGDGGKRYPSYQQMAFHLARAGCIVWVPDNLGQGERQPMGHSTAYQPFACGLSLQSLIIMEALGWLAKAREDRRIDQHRMAIIGNSGGGTLSLLVAGLCDDLVAAAPSGYPTTFDFVARKEKIHCACNLLPGLVGRVEMSDVLGCFAPRPLLLSQGVHDNLFPIDLFYRCARETRQAYTALGAEQALQLLTSPGEHAWDTERIAGTVRWLASVLDLPEAPVDLAPAPLGANTPLCIKSWPKSAPTTAQLAQTLSGRKIEKIPELWEIFVPSCELPTSPVLTDRGDARIILAQFAAFLNGFEHAD